MSDERRNVFAFPGNEIDVTWDRRLCIHVAECTKAQGEVFEAGRTPWGDPDRASADEVVEVVERCPSGALAHSRDEAPPAVNTVVVANGGPLYFHGDLAIEGAADDMPGVRTRAALCRCGRSANKPFCDNSHRAADFDDAGAIGAGPGGGGGLAGGPLTITPAPDGPLLLAGPLTLVTGAGRPATTTEKAAFCRCGASANKPFCDGSHKRVGFTSD